MKCFKRFSDCFNLKVQYIDNFMYVEFNRADQVYQVAMESLDKEGLPDQE